MVVKVATCQNVLPLQPRLAVVLVKEIDGVEGEVLYWGLARDFLLRHRGRPKDFGLRDDGLVSPD